MTTPARRSPSHEIKPAAQEAEDVVEAGVERYMWAFPEGNRVVLAIPGLRDLKLNVDEARTIGGLLIQTADEMVKNRSNLGEGGDNHGGSEEYPVER